MTEHVLNYDHSVVPQERYWDCGPASTQVVLSGRGIVESETDLIGQIGTTINGTDDISWILRAIGDGYKVDYIRNDPPTADQVNLFWSRVRKSIDAGYGLVANIVAPPSNYPKGVKGSVSPSYSGGTVYHYIALMGYDDTPGAEAVWVADPGFRPFGYWVSLQQLAGLIAPKGYCWQDNAPAAPAAVTQNDPPAQVTNMEGVTVDWATWAYWVDLRVKLTQDQVSGGDDFRGWPQLANHTIVDAVALIMKKLGAE